MENQLETIKANLPYGYEKQIAKEVGCSQGTVHNILNNKPASARSTYKAKVLNVAVRMANEAPRSYKRSFQSGSRIRDFASWICKLILP